MEKIIHDAQTGAVSVVPYTPEEQAAFMQRRANMAMPLLRAERNRLLVESDVYVLPDRWDAMSQDKRSEWAIYRQALRDMPETVVDVLNPVWPKVPD